MVESASIRGVTRGLQAPRADVSGMGSGYTSFMKHERLLGIVSILVLLVSSSSLAAGGVDLRYPDGTPVPWEKWLAKTAPVAVVVWSSWQPRAAGVLEHRAALETACSSKGLRLVFVDVVEPLEDGRKALASSGVTWLHDRHGSLLKRCRVVTVPALVVLDRSGKVLARLEPTAEAVEAWSGP